MEIFNNVAIHAYQRGDGGSSAGTIDLTITPGPADLIIELTDTGQSFDLEGVAALPTDPDPDRLPEGGMGIHIAKTMLDEMTYQPGPPNHWRLMKRLQPIRKKRLSTAAGGRG
jgi:serine/threonine-protein kinase RsbW